MFDSLNFLNIDLIDKYQSVIDENLPLMLRKSVTLVYALLNQAKRWCVLYKIN